MKNTVQTYENHIKILRDDEFQQSKLFKSLERNLKHTEKESTILQNKFIQIEEMFNILNNEKIKDKNKLQESEIEQDKLNLEIIELKSKCKQIKHEHSSCENNTNHLKSDLQEIKHIQMTESKNYEEELKI